MLKVWKKLTVQFFFLEVKNVVYNILYYGLGQGKFDFGSHRGQPKVIVPH